MDKVDVHPHDAEEGVTEDDPDTLLVSSIISRVKLHLFIKEFEKFLKRIGKLWLWSLNRSAILDQVIAILLVFMADILKHSQYSVGLLQLLSQLLSPGSNL